jgi:hypothetical protein
LSDSTIVKNAGQSLYLVDVFDAFYIFAAMAENLSFEKRSKISAGIVEMIARTDVEEVAMSWLGRPSPLLQLERRLLDYGNYRFKNGYARFRGMTLSQIAKEVREQSIDGIAFTEELLDQAISHMIEIN